MKRVIFGTYDFLAPVIFWSIFLDLMDQKMAGSKKVVKTKNQLFHARQPREGIFEIRSERGLIFTKKKINLSGHHLYADRHLGYGIPSFKMVSARPAFHESSTHPSMIYYIRDLCFLLRIPDTYIND